MFTDSGRRHTVTEFSGPHLRVFISCYVGQAGGLCSSMSVETHRIARSNSAESPAENTPNHPLEFRRITRWATPSALPSRGAGAIVTAFPRLTAWRRMDYLPRIVDAELAELLEAAGAVLIEGPKACGKTATAMRAAESEVLLDVDDNARRMISVDPAIVLDGDTPRGHLQSQRKEKRSGQGGAPSAVAGPEHRHPRRDVEAGGRRRARR